MSKLSSFSFGLIIWYLKFVGLIYFVYVLGKLIKGGKTLSVKKFFIPRVRTRNLSLRGVFITGDNWLLQYNTNIEVEKSSKYV